MLKIQLYEDVDIHINIPKDAKKKLARKAIHHIIASARSINPDAVVRKLPKKEDYASNRGIIEVNIGDYNYEGMHIYGANVTLMRAVPDIIDGFKPLERRILYATAFLAKALKAKKKVLAIVGTVSFIHPHGDASVGDAFTNMSKPWENAYPLMSIKGNNGQPSGARAAATRYLEGMISDYAYDCFFSEWDNNVVEMTQSYNPEFMEPEYLNSKYPNILLRPVTGFTFSIATDFPAYNMEESFNAVIELIKDKNYEPVLFPDLPSGCTIVDEGQFPDICKNGTGIFKMKADIEVDHKNNQLIVHSLPYKVTVESVINTLVELNKTKAIAGLVNFHDYSNKYGINLRLIFSKDVSITDAIPILYKKTPLMSSFGVHMEFVDNYELKKFNLKQIMQKWIDSRRIVKRKFTIYRLVHLRERNHILEVMVDITSSESKSIEMVKAIRTCKTEEIIKRLMTAYSGISSLQAKEIANMRVKEFSIDSNAKFVKELKDNEKEIEKLDDFISSPKKIDKVIIKELQDAIAKYAVPRRSRIEKFKEIRDSSENDTTEYILVFTSKGNVKKLYDKTSGIGELNDGDDPILVTKAKNNDKIVVFDKGGMIHTIKVSAIAQGSLKDKGHSIGKYAGLKGDVVTVIPYSKIDGGEFVFITERGIIKKTSCDKYGFKTSVTSINLRENDGLASVIYTKGDTDILIYTKRGVGNRIHTGEVTETSRLSVGVIAVNVSEDDSVAGVIQIGNKATHLAMLTTKGNGKVCPIDSLETGKRRDESLILIGLNQKEELFGIIPCRRDSTFRVVMKKWNGLLDFDMFPELTRTHYGKKILSVPNGEQIVRFMLVA